MESPPPPPPPRRPLPGAPAAPASPSAHTAPAPPAAPQFTPSTPVAPAAPPAPAPVSALRPAAAPVAASSPKSIEVKLTNPQKAGEGLKTHITFEVQTTALLPELAGMYATPHSSVRRAFKDFQAIRDLLQSMFPHVIMPFPEKTATEAVLNKKDGYTPEYVESRRRKLERFLRRLADHPEIIKTQEFHAFLTNQDASLPKGGNVMEKAASVTASLLKKASVGVAQATRAPVPKDDPLQPTIEWFRGFELSCEKAQETSKHLAKQKTDMASCVGQLGAILADLGRGEHTNVGMPLLEAFGETYQALNAVSVGLSAQAVIDDETVSDLFKEYLLYCAGFKAVEMHREELYGVVDGLRSQLEKTRSSLQSLQETGHASQTDKMLGQAMSLFGGKKEKKDTTAQEAHIAGDIQKLEGELAAAQKEYEAFAAKVKLEVARVHKIKAKEYKTMLREFAGAQIAFHSLSLATWQSTIAKIDSVPNEP